MYWLSYIYSKFCKTYNIIILKDEQLDKYNNKIQNFEKKMSHWYPFNSEDSFKIDHCKNYFSFFKRIGYVIVATILDQNYDIKGTFIGILRLIDNNKVWYLCDLKIDPEYRGRWLTYKMLIKCLELLKISNKFYGITMNNNNKKNKIVTLAHNITNILNINIKIDQLKIYMINHIEMKKIKDILEHYKGKIFFNNMNNYKKLIMKSTNKPLKLLHVNYYKNIINNNNENIDIIIKEDYLYMFCLHSNDKLNYILKKNNIVTEITASIIHNLDCDNWDFIQTSEI